MTTSLQRFGSEITALRDETQNTPLVLAGAAGRDNTVEVLLDSKADMVRTERSRLNAYLLSAAERAERRRQDRPLRGVRGGLWHHGADPARGEGRRPCLRGHW